jgi:hypothetical protein
MYPLYNALLKFHGAPGRLAYQRLAGCAPFGPPAVSWLRGLRHRFNLGTIEETPARCVTRGR